MKDDKSKDNIELLGEFLRDRAPSAEEEGAALDRLWQEMRVQQNFRVMPAKSSIVRYVWAAAAAAAVIAIILVGVSLRHASPAIVARTGGALENVGWDEVIRTGNKTRTVLTLDDGSQIEMRSNSALALEKAGIGVRIRLDNGGLFINAAKQRQGPLYVQTKDVIVSVVGTVFMVNAEEAGSRVAVVEGEVHVQQGDKTSRLLPGQQVATNPLMAEHPVVEQLAWSRSAEPYLAPLQQPKRLEFEVATLRPVGPAPGKRRATAHLRCKGSDGEFRPVVGNEPPIPLGRCVSGAVNLETLLETAYDIQRISGLPSFSEQPMFQLEARAEDPATTTREQLRQMLQNLLMDKLKLKLHRETKEIEGYVLTIGKDGVKFKETSADEEIPSWLPNGGARIDASGQALPTLYEGKSRMNLFVNSLSSVSRLPIIDKTGLQALYDIRFTIDLLLPPPPPGGGGPRGGGGANAGPPPPQEFDPPLPKAIEEQLGLRLERGKVPVEYLVVDHYEVVKED
jgi:uncharacterized protein (TIGR03435 family)